MLDDEGFVFAVTHDAEKEIVGSVLFEFDTVADGVGGVQEHANAQGKVGLFAEVANVLLNIIVENFEVLLVESGNEFIATVEDGEQDVDEIDLNRDRHLAFLQGFLRVLRVCRRRSGWILLLRANKSAGQEREDRKERA